MRTHDILVAFQSFSRRRSLLERMLNSMAIDLGATRVQAVDAYYAEKNDTALLMIHIDPSLVTRSVLSGVARATNHEGTKVIDTALLDPAQRDRLFNSVLVQYPFQRLHLAGLVEAYRSLDPTADAGRDHEAPSLRFQRGTEWFPGRLCRIDEDGMYIASAGLPRAGDRIEIELETPHGLLKQEASVSYVTKPEVSGSGGATGFIARFTTGNFGRKCGDSTLPRVG